MNFRSKGNKKKYLQILWQSKHGRVKLDSNSEHHLPIIMQKCQQTLLEIQQDPNEANIQNCYELMTTDEYLCQQIQTNMFKPCFKTDAGKYFLENCKEYWILLLYIFELAYEDRTQLYKHIFSKIYEAMEDFLKDTQRIMFIVSEVDKLEKIELRQQLKLIGKNFDHLQNERTAIIEELPIYLTQQEDINMNHDINYLTQAEEGAIYDELEQCQKNSKAQQDVVQPSLSEQEQIKSSTQHKDNGKQQEQNIYISMNDNIGYLGQTQEGRIYNESEQHQEDQQAQKAGAELLEFHSDSASQKSISRQVQITCQAQHPDNGEYREQNINNIRLKTEIGTCHNYDESYSVDEESKSNLQQLRIQSDQIMSTDYLTQTSALQRNNSVIIPMDLKPQNQSEEKIQQQIDNQSNRLNIYQEKDDDGLIWNKSGPILQDSGKHSLSSKGSEYHGADNEIKLKESSKLNSKIKHERNQWDLQFVDQNIFSDSIIQNLGSLEQLIQWLEKIKVAPHDKEFRFLIEEFQQKLINKLSQNPNNQILTFEEEKDGFQPNSLASGISIKENKKEWFEKLISEIKNTKEIEQKLLQFQQIQQKQSQSLKDIREIDHINKIPPPSQKIISNEFMANFTDQLYDASLLRMVEQGSNIKAIGEIDNEQENYRDQKKISQSARVTQDIQMKRPNGNFISQNSLNSEEKSNRMSINEQVKVNPFYDDVQQDEFRLRKSLESQQDKSFVQQFESLNIHTNGPSVEIKQVESDEEHLDQKKISQFSVSQDQIQNNSNSKKNSDLLPLKDSKAELFDFDRDEDLKEPIFSFKPKKIGKIIYDYHSVQSVNEVFQVFVEVNSLGNKNFDAIARILSPGHRLHGKRAIITLKQGQPADHFSDYLLYCAYIDSVYDQKERILLPLETYQIIPQ